MGVISCFDVSTLLNEVIDRLLSNEQKLLVVVYVMSFSGFRYANGPYRFSNLPLVWYNVYCT